MKILYSKNPLNFGYCLIALAELDFQYQFSVYNLRKCILIMTINYFWPVLMSKSRFINYVFRWLFYINKDVL